MNHAVFSLNHSNDILTTLHVNNLFLTMNVYSVSVGTGVSRQIILKRSLKKKKKKKGKTGMDKRIKNE